LKTRGEKQILRMHKDHWGGRRRGAVNTKESTHASKRGVNAIGRGKYHLTLKGAGENEEAKVRGFRNMRYHVEKR